MVYITGDIHGNPIRLSTDVFYEQKEFNGNKDENTIIVTGDFGLVWNRNEESQKEKEWLDWIEDKPFTTVFVDGNHENHERLAEYPIKEWNGGLVHEIRPHVLHLMRGQVFTIEDKKFFTFGGASSHDIQDGILDYDDPYWKDKAKALDKQGKYMYRIKGLSWWSQELPVLYELNTGLQNLQKNNNKVDFIITHCISSSTAALMGFHDVDILNKYFEQIKETIEYNKWFFGHYHMNKQITNKDFCLYEQIIRII